MKLTYTQLESHLNQSLAGIYLISGDEPWLKQEALRLLRSYAKRADFNEYIRIVPETGFNWEELHTAFYSTSLFADKQIIELDLRFIAPNKIAGDILEHYGKKPAAQTLLIINLNKIDDKIAKQKWYQTLEKAGIVITIWPIPREQFPQWIMQRAKKYKMSLATDVVNLIADYTEGNLAAAAQAIEKLYLLSVIPAQAGIHSAQAGTHSAQAGIQSTQAGIHIDSNTIHALMTDESRFSLFDFIQHLISGNAKHALHILNQLKIEGTEPVLIVWSIARELRLLIELLTQLTNGMSFEKLCKQHRIYFQRQTAVQHFLKIFTVNHCLQFLADLAQIDKMIKGATSGDVWQALELFCLRLYNKV